MDLCLSLKLKKIHTVHLKRKLKQGVNDSKCCSAVLGVQISICLTFVCCPSGKSVFRRCPNPVHSKKDECSPSHNKNLSHFNPASVLPADLILQICT